MAPIAYDITRLFLGPLSRSPRGIDRVDLAVARHLFAAGNSENVGVLPTPWGVRVYDAARVRRGIDHVMRLWDGAESETDPLWQPLVQRLTQGPADTSASASPPLGIGRKLKRMAGELGATGFALGRPVRRAVPLGAIYLNIGQIGLAVPAFFRWLDDRPDVTAAIMLHDAIPLDHPEQVERSSRAHHERMVRTAARHADVLVVSTDHARARVGEALARHGRMDVPTLTRRLPLPDRFTVLRESDPALVSTRYFVVCATIEPRKNHDLLAKVWRRLTSDLGEAAPHLVLVGSPGFRAGAILGPILADAALRRRVHYVAGLSTPALIRLMLGAAAVLSPSLAEGFGLPVLEANALGVPTIASDIPAHREVANTSTTLLPCTDEEAWRTAVLAQGGGGIRQTPAICPSLSEYTYCKELLDYLAIFSNRVRNRG